jgi:eukaryotic translation initiation factor 2C
MFGLLDVHPDFQIYRTATAHDFSAKMVAAKPLPQPLTFEISYFEEDDSGRGRAEREGTRKTYALDITYIQPIPLDGLRAYLAGDPSARSTDVAPVLSALNIILAQHPMRNGVLVGRNRYCFRAEAFPLGGGFEAWKGFYSSVRPTFKSLMVNVNGETTVLCGEGKLANAMFDFKSATFGARIDAFLQEVRIQTTYLGHKKNVKRTCRFAAKTYRFEWDELGGKSVTVEEYFQRSKSAFL